MRVILTTDVESVGKMGEIKEVKNGLGSNYLIPKKLAIIATPGNIKVWEQKSNIINKREEDLKAEAQGFASKLDGASVTITVKVGQEEKIFGSVTSQNISEALKEAGFEVSRKDIKLESPIKALGTHDVSVKLYQEVEAIISVSVVGENGEVTEAETTEEIPEEAAAETDSQPQEIEEKENEEPEEAVEEEK
jgi:large subunit ribosomal protein L9